ncbi:hypothetical protein UCRPA7_7341 [Phaeoacremonium minimum UCRPA7]|uniref:Methyltransferase n=1 Tax=Phaeoacremonium minimum (strain UCR-PA7) TaxID=1286976 RepID=R8BCY3_PHAM7|nr:hypothetical protein UCRPA7_7341 [Phaeoacremonium minimum UCRPA7]EON97151.1 hypothetical protein UCRPA7_7341 [Phaeoacremonium minimum UCRPA7]
MTEVIAPLGFTEPLPVRLKFHANDRTGDVLNTVPRDARIEDARSRSKPPSLDVEGFTLITHQSKVQNFRDTEEVERVYGEEIRQLLLELTGADGVEIRGAAVLRFGERSQDSGAHNNSRPGRFVHIDASDAAAGFFNSQLAVPEGRRLKRAVQYNVWRSITPPPQDVPLAVCEAGSIDPKDFVFADALFDTDGEILMSFESVLLQYNPMQRWVFFANMRPDEALIFKTNDTQPGTAHHVPHGAFDDPNCPPDTLPRASVEMRATAFWYE